MGSSKRATHSSTARLLVITVAARLLIPLDQDVVEVARLLSGELAQPDVVEDDDVGGQPGAELALEGVIGARLQQGLQELGDLADASATATTSPTAPLSAATVAL
jgi:hypothetical protein